MHFNKPCLLSFAKLIDECVFQNVEVFFINLCVKYSMLTFHVLPSQWIQNLVSTPVAFNFGFVKWYVIIMGWRKAIKGCTQGWAVWEPAICKLVSHYFIVCPVRVTRTHIPLLGWHEVTHLPEGSTVFGSLQFKKWLFEMPFFLHAEVRPIEINGHFMHYTAAA